MEVRKGRETSSALGNTAQDCPQQKAILNASQFMAKKKAVDSFPRLLFS
jgi:hypothetical protein